TQPTPPHQGFLANRWDSAGFEFRRGLAEWLVWVGWEWLDWRNGGLKPTLRNTLRNTLQPTHQPYALPTHFPANPLKILPHALKTRNNTGFRPSG
ncbi:TPA: hypothetical protein ACJJCF_002096, partial [Neisseria meningitidis]